MNKIAVPFLSFGLAFFPLSIRPAAHAASLSWDAPVTVSADTDIDLTGTLVHAGSWGTSNITVNAAGIENILFEDRPVNDSDPEASVTANDEYDGSLNMYVGDTGNTNLNTVLNSFAGGQVKILTLGGLVSSAQYQVQLFTVDERAASSARTQKWSDALTDGAGNESADVTRGTLTAVTGTFTADSGSQVIYGLPVNNPDTILNAYVLREVAPPTPGIFFAAGSTVRTPEGIIQPYTLNTRTVPASAISVSITAPSDLEVSLDGNSFSASVTASLNNMTPVSVFFRGIADGTPEPTEHHALAHAITAGDGGDYTPALPIDDLKVELQDALMSQTGDLAVFSNGGASIEVFEGGATITHAFSETITEAQSSCALAQNSEEILLAGGRYLVLYNVGVHQLNGAGRAEMLSHLSLTTSGTTNDLAYGWSQGYIRNTAGADETFLSGGAIIQAPANARLRLHTERSDANLDKMVRILPGNVAIQVLKLDDAADGIRLSHSGDVPAPTNAFAAVAYDQVDEASTSALSYDTPTQAIQINEGGQYLLMANTHLDRTGVSTNGTRLAFAQRLTLDGAEINGSKTTTYIRGNVDTEDCYNGTTALGMIIQTTAGQSLQLQLRQEGIQTVNIIGARTGLALVKLPATSELIRLEDFSGQDLNPAARTPLTFATQAGTVDPVFTHSAATSAVSVNEIGRYLFLSAFYCDMDTTDRQVSLQDWTIDGTPTGYGQGSQYSRNDTTFRAGNWSGFAGTLRAANAVEANAQRLAAGGLLPGDSLGLQGLNIASLSGTPLLLVNKQLGLSAGAERAITTNELFAVDADTPASSITYTVDSLPAGGTLRRLTTTVNSGETFTQEDIELGRMSFLAAGTAGSEFGFAFSLSDGGSPTPAGFFSVLIAPSIVISDEAGATDEDTSITAVNGGVTNLFANDSGEALQLSRFDATSARGAAVIVNADGTFSYDPNGAINLQTLGNGDTPNDTFTYTLTDVVGAHGTGTVTIAVSGVEDEFAASPDFADDPANPILESGAQSLSFQPLLNDGIVRTANGTTNDILLLNYDASADTGTGVWKNFGSAGGSALDWQLGSGVRIERPRRSTLAGIRAAYQWDGTPNSAVVYPGVISINDVLGAAVDQQNASIECWVQLEPADLGQISTLFETGGGTGAGIVVDNGVLKAANGLGVAETQYDLLADPLNIMGAGPTGDFFQVVWSMDLTNDVNSLYVNGTLVDSAANPATIDWDGGDASGIGHFQGTNHGGFQNGAAGTAYDTFFHGAMAIMRLYGAALSPANVHQNFQAIDAGATDLEGDVLTIAGLFNASSTLVPGTGQEITLASGGIVRLDSVNGDFTYDPTGIPGVTDLAFGDSIIDQFDYQATDGNGTTADSTIFVSIYGESSAVDDMLTVQENLVTTLTPNQLVGNDQHTAGTAGAYVLLDARDANDLLNGLWPNTGSSGATHDATINGGAVIVPRTGFGALGKSLLNPQAQQATLDPISTTDATFELWFKPRRSIGRSMLYETGGSGVGLSIVYDGDLNTVTLTIDGGTDNNPDQQIRVDAGGIRTDEFNQLVVVYDRDTASGDGNDDAVTLYVNNDPSAGFNPTPAAMAVNTGGGVNDWSGTDATGIGTVVGAAALTEFPQNFAGEIAQVVVYARMLSIAEIQANFEARIIPLQSITPASPIRTSLGALVTLQPNGSIQYDATSLTADIPVGVVAQDSFTYTTSDGAGGTTTATATVNVTGTGSLLAIDDLVRVGESEMRSFDPRTNDLGAASATVILQTDLANYATDFTAGTVNGESADFRDGNGTGWQFLWNAPTDWDTGLFDASTGPLGSTNDYDQLVWDAALGAWLADADGVSSNAPPGNWLSLSGTGGHPGPGAVEDKGVTNTLERFAIAAYTVASNGTYAITSSTITKPSTAGGNGVRVITSVNDSLRGVTPAAAGATASFDQELGTLQTGDTIYVAAGPEANQGSDTFTWDFTISLVAPGGGSPLIGSVTNDASSITYDTAGRFENLPLGTSAFEQISYLIAFGGEVSSAIATIEIQGENDLPSGVADTLGTDEDTTAMGTLLDNDSDIDRGETALLSVAEVQGDGGNVGLPAATDRGGLVTVATNGVFTYDPNSAFEFLGLGEMATDSFAYLVSDPTGASAVSSTVVSITILGVDDGVIATSNNYVAATNSVVMGNLIKDDTGAGADQSIDANDLLSVLSLDLTGTLGQVNFATNRVVGVRGSATLSNAVVVTVNFGAGVFTNPVVIAGPLSFNGLEPSIVVVSNVNATAGTFDIRIKEQTEGGATSDNDGDAHAVDDVDWMVLEEGSYLLPNGKRMEVGSVTTAANKDSQTPTFYEAITFSETFPTAPLVFHLAQTVNGTGAEFTEFFGTRLNGLPDTNGFEVAIEDYQGDTTPRTTAERIGWVAIEPGTGSINGNVFEAGLTPALVNENPYTINYLRSYTSVPQFVASQVTRNGNDPTQIRRENVGISSTQVRAREDTFGDTEIAHANEQVAYLVIGGNGALTAYPQGLVPGSFTYDPNGAFDGLTPGQTATDTFRYVLTDGNGNTDTNLVTITITTDNILADWRVANGFAADGSGPGEGNLEDKEGDGLNNLQEFAFGTDPNLADNEFLQVDLDGNTFVPGRLLAMYDGATWGVFVRRADHADAGLVYTPQFSVDFGLWTDSAAAITVLIPDSGSGYELIAVPFTEFPANSGDRSYGRVRVVYSGP